MSPHAAPPRTAVPAIRTGLAARVSFASFLVRDAATGDTIPCRINVVGRDGHYYQPRHDRFPRFALTSVFGQAGIAWGNRQGKPPYRYLGRFFYCTGVALVRAPFQLAAIEAWIAKIDAQIATHSRRSFPEWDKVVGYFQQARDVLLRIRAQGGPAGGRA